MTTTAEQDALRLNSQAVLAMSNRRPAEAADLLRRALELDPMLLPAWINLAVSRRLQGDLGGALANVDQALKLDPMAFRALLMRASLLESLGKLRQAGNAYNNALGLMPSPETMDDATRRAVEHGLEFHARHVEQMDAALKNSLFDKDLHGSSGEMRRMRHFVDHLTGKRRRYESQPTNFFYPGLPCIEFFDREEFPWLEEVEAATPRIQDELAGVLGDEVAAADLEPYMQRGDGEPVEQWTELNKSLKWSAYHFAIYGRQFESHRRKCPFTASLLDRMPQPVIQNRSPASLFSILQPKTHIPPHNGVANIRLLCHLPLILPPDCRFRVGNSLREWKIGEAFVFDDSIEHEAWNDSDQVRAVLIFDIWHPYLSETERDFVTRAMVALDQFNAEDG
jgi:aspartate beta-hydroxylase